MKTFKVYPPGYDPHIAISPPSEHYIRLGITWTQEDTQRAQELESRAITVTISDERQWPVIGQWCQEIEENENV